MSTNPLHAVPAPEPVPTEHMRVSDLRQFKGQIGATVRLGADPTHGYVDVSVRVNENNPKVRDALAALREAFREIAADAAAGAVRDAQRRSS